MTLTVGSLYSGSFNIKDGTGALVAPTSGPTLTLYLDGIADSTVVTPVSSGVAGVYTYSFTVPNDVGAAATVGLAATLPGSVAITAADVLGDIIAAPTAGASFINGQIASYSGLVASIAKWLWRTGDSDTEAYIPDMVSMAEAYFSRRFRDRDMEASVSSLAVVDGVASLPSDFRAVVSVRDTAYEHYQLKPKPIDQIEMFEDITSGKLQFYDVLGGEMHFWPRVTTTVRLRYLQAIPALSDSNTSNWLLQKHPDLYLYQTLACGEAFNMNDQRVAMWKAKAEQALYDVEQEDIHLHQDALTPTPSTGVAI